MMHAYQETYVNKAQSLLGTTFDYAVNVCDIPGNEFVQLFESSTISRKMENGETAILLGKSGIEVLSEILEIDDMKVEIKVCKRYSRTREYWIGWIIAYYQWLTSRTYNEIFDAIKYDELEKMYDAYHEADVSKFVDTLNKIMKQHYPETNLKRFRTLYGCTQAELAQYSGVSLRSIQMYEQRNKDINKASAETLYRLSKVLGCTIEDLIEK